MLTCNPNTLILHITEKCNMRCRYCFQSKEGILQDMDYNTGRSAIDWFLPYVQGSKAEIRFFGGEPLLKFELLKRLVNYSKTISQSKNVSLKFQITTNGTIINESMIEFFNGNNISLLISIDGKPQYHNLNRVNFKGKGTFSLISKNLEVLMKHMNIGARLTFTDETIHCLAENLEFLISMGFPTIGFAPDDEMQWNDELLLALQKEMDKIFELWKRIKQSGEYIKILPLDKYLKNIDKEYSWHYHMHQCECIKDAISIVSNGNIYPCHRFADQRAFRLGNIKTDALNSLRIPKDIFSPELYKNNPGCPSLNFKVNGNVNIKPEGVIEVMKIYHAAAVRMNEFLKSAKESHV